MPSLASMTSYQDPTFFKPMSREEIAARRAPPVVLGFDYGVGDMTSIAVAEVVPAPPTKMTLDDMLDCVVIPAKCKATPKAAPEKAPLTIRPGHYDDRQNMVRMRMCVDGDLVMIRPADRCGSPTHTRPWGCFPDMPR